MEYRLEVLGEVYGCKQYASSIGSRAIREMVVNMHPGRKGGERTMSKRLSFYAEKGRFQIGLIFEQSIYERF